jgi:hypothetical protein
MLFTDHVGLTDYLNHKKWFMYSHLEPLFWEEGNTCLGAIANLHYDTNARKLWLIFPFKEYLSPRAYVESVWTRGDILRVPEEGLADKSVPTKDIQYIEWYFLLGPKKDISDEYHVDGFGRDELLHCLYKHMTTAFKLNFPEPRS